MKSKPFMFALITFQGTATPWGKATKQGLSAVPNNDSNPRLNTHFSVALPKADLQEVVISVAAASGVVAIGPMLGCQLPAQPREKRDNL